MNTLTILIREFARDRLDQNFKKQLAKSLTISISRSNGNRLSMNKHLHRIAALMLLDEGRGQRLVTDLIRLIPEVSRSTVTNARTIAVLHCSFRISNQQSAEYLRTVKDAIGLQWYTALARQMGLQIAGCGHMDNNPYVLWGPRPSLRMTLCQDCASEHLRSGNWLLGSHQTLIEASRAVSARFGSNDLRIVDNRDSGIRFDAVRQQWFGHGYLPGQDLILGYHSARRNGWRVVQSPWFKSHKRAFGMELELEVVSNRDRYEVADTINTKLNDGEFGAYCYMENDGSLQNGIEIVTQPAGLDTHAERLDKFLNDKTAKRGLRSHEGGRCGLHVHVGREYLSRAQIIRIQAFLNDVNNHELIKKIARRYDSSYSRYKPTMGKLSTKGKLSNDRYEALNITNNGTVEFRIFRGSLRFESVMASLEFVNAICEFCVPGQVSFRDFNSNGFKDFILQPRMRADTKFLRKYMGMTIDQVTDQEAA